MNATANDNANLEAIHMLRGIAALLVVFFHVRPFFDYLVPGLGAFFEGGYSGVDIFFIISGFIICYSTQRPQTATQFLVRRLFRVWLPAVVAGVLYVLVTSRAMTPIDGYRLLSIEPQASSGGPYYGYGVYFITWTIAYELCFYAVFALALGLSHRWRVALALALLMGGGALLQAMLTGTWSSDPYAMDPVHGAWLPATALKALLLVMNPLSWMFAIGMGFYLAWPALRRVLSRLDDQWLGIAFALPLLVYAWGYFAGARGHGLFNIGIFAVAAFAAFVALQVRLDRAAERGYRAPAALMFLGTMSYSLYLCHPIVMDLRYLVVAQFTKLNLMGVPFIVLGAVLVGSAIFYRLVEVPSQRLGRRLARGLPARRERVSAVAQGA